MRYHYEKPRHYTSMYGVIYACDHPVYDQCTLYLIENCCHPAKIRPRYKANLVGRDRPMVGR